jgi:hypothetical protein
MRFIAGRAIEQAESIEIIREAYYTIKVDDDDD